MQAIRSTHSLQWQGAVHVLSAQNTGQHHLASAAGTTQS